MDELICMCCLNRIFGFKPDLSRALVRTLGSASAVFTLTGDQLFELLPGSYKIRKEICGETLEKTSIELEHLARQGIHFLPFTDPAFPPLLKETPNGPIGLYVRGQLPDIGRNCIAVVGTRSISNYGSEWCRRIVDTLASIPEKPAIISGLALGTDIRAHEAAVRDGLPSIGVLPCGIDTVYPHQHHDFAEALCRLPESGLVTDYPPATAPLPIHFLRRNRIIAGMASATIVIESGIRGGSMITARDAFEFNREVYALPGRVDDPHSQGCNYLIRNDMAEAIESMESLKESLAAALKFRRKADPEPLLFDPDAPDLYD